MVEIPTVNKFFTNISNTKYKNKVYQGKCVCMVVIVHSDKIIDVLGSSSVGLLLYS